MTVHPGVLPQPPRATVRRASAPTPATTSRSRWTYAEGCGRCSSASALERLPPRAVRRRRDGRTPARSPRWPGSTRACTSVRRGGSSTPRRHRCASAPLSPRPPGSRAAPGFIDDTRAFLSIPARHDMARRAGCRVPGPARARRAGSAHAGSRANHRRPRRRSTRRGVQAVRIRISACTRALAERGGTQVDAAPVRIVHLGLGAFSRRTPAWYTARGRGCRRVGHRGLHGSQPARCRTASPPRRACTPSSSRGGRTTARGHRKHLRARSTAPRRRPLSSPNIAAPATAIVTLTITEAGYRLTGRRAGRR